MSGKDRRKALRVFVPAILIIVLLAAVAIPLWLKARPQGKRVHSVTVLHTCRAAVEAYIAATGRAPPDLRCLTDPNLNPPRVHFVARKDTMDAWGTQIRFRSVGTNFSFTAAGPDKVFDTQDDIGL